MNNLQHDYLDVRSLLAPFIDQSAVVRSIVAVGCHEIPALTLSDGPSLKAALLRLAVDSGVSYTVTSREPIAAAARGTEGESTPTLESLAHHASEVSGLEPGNDLLILPKHVMKKIMTPVAVEFAFRCVAVVLPQEATQPSDANGWRLRRSLFDRGLVCMGSAQVAGSKVLCFLASDAVRSIPQLDVEARGVVSMKGFADGGRFANQLFRYAYVKFYAVRHGLTAALPAWEGQQLFGLEDKPCEGLTLPVVSFRGFSDEDRLLWKLDNPPINIDMIGYFQEIPECWRKHRALLRRLFQLPHEQVQAFDTWRDSVTDNGRRALVAIHLRRGDYRILQDRKVPWFRMVPEDWYLHWLRSIWPSLSNPVLFVATDEPDTILPKFREFEMVAPTLGSSAQALPDYVRDFETLRRADCLAICNSSFSRMAAILAPAAQKCWLPSFESQALVPYEPWVDPAFWARFADSWRDTETRATRQHRPAPSAPGNVATPVGAPAILLDVSDLLFYLLHHATLSGIQRVQYEILRNLVGVANSQPIRFVVLNKRGALGEIDATGLLEVIDHLRSDASARSDIEAGLRSLVARVVPFMARPRDVFLTIGAFWTVRGTGLLLQNLKNSGVTIGVFIHDIIPISAPEYFEERPAKVFTKGIIEALTFADFVMTTSEYNKAALMEYIASRRLDALPVHPVPLGHALSHSAPVEFAISTVVAGILETDFVLCVGTIEVRKNPSYLFNIWKMMVQSGRTNIPYLVLAGRKGWLVQDFMDQLKACNYLNGRILVVSNVTDVELESLYRKCILTMFPSFVEGWGLPVGESLAYGKICLCSAIGGIPEVGGEFVDHIDPYNASDGLAKLVRYLDDPELRLIRERDIADRFEPRSWKTAADELLRSTQALARQVQPFEGVVAITLPPNRFLSISGETAGTDDALATELVCLSGWDAPDGTGVRAVDPEAVIRFRVEEPVGTKINLVVRLAAQGRDFRIGINSASGAESEVLVAAGSEKLATLSCVVEPEKLVTAYLTLLDVGGEVAVNASWRLKGLLYFDPKRVALEALKRARVGSAGHSPVTAAPSQLIHQPGPPAPVEPRGEQVFIRAASMDESRRANSFGAFLQTTDSYWPSEFAVERDAPIFANHEDRRAFYTGCGKSANAFPVGRVNDSIKLVRRSDQYVSMARFSEGSVFDRSGVWRNLGYLQGSPKDRAPWLTKEADGVSIDERALKSAPYYDHSYLIFYNGNLHNYYHWLIEGLLPLDILSRSLGLGSNLRIVLPKSMDINALIDHREALRAVGLGGREIIEVGEDLIRVREAIWVDSDLVQTMPAPYLKDFQQRVAALYAVLRGPRNRRLLVARKGPTRKIHNLEQVQAFLSRYDFETVYLEGMSTVDQILLFQSAEFIIAPHGAGLSNLLFCEPGTKVIELMPSTEIRPFFWLISEKLNLVHGMQFCASVPSPDFQAAITVDVNKLQALIKMVDAHL